jgi:hypothetical protein
MIVRILEAAFVMTYFGVCIYIVMLCLPVKGEGR